MRLPGECGVARASGGRGARVEGTWRRACREGAVVTRAVRAGLARAGLGIILMCKIDLWGNAHVFWQGQGFKDNRESVLLAYPR